MRALVAGIAVAAASLTAQAQREAVVVGLSGTVLAPDGTPVTSGRITLVRAISNRATAAIDRDGHFRIIPDVAGSFRAIIVVPGLTPHRFNIEVPASRTVTLPDIKLLPAVYYRVQLLSPAGEPVTASVQKQFADANGLTIPGMDLQVTEQADADGTITIGPLPISVMTLAVDAAPFARTQLSDVTVTGKTPLIDGGTIRLEAGSRLNVDIVDAHGAPVPNHGVSLENTRSGLIVLRPERTDARGRASFDRLSAGRYRIWTMTVERCNTQQMFITRVVAVGSGGEDRARLVIGGTARFRIVTPTGAMNGARVSAAPDSAQATPPFQPVFTNPYSLRRATPSPRSDPSCNGATNAEGRLTLTPFPPGPANVSVRLFNSTFKRRVIVPEGGREVEITIPDGVVSAHVTNQRTSRPLANASVVWLGSGARVDAITNANGDVLIEGTGTLAGTLSASAMNYETLEASFPEPPGIPQEVALPPLRSAYLQARVIKATGEPVSNALVEMAPANPLDVSDFAVTLANGMVSFSDAPQGALQLTVIAEGFVTKTVRIAADDHDEAVITLTPVAK